MSFAQSYTTGCQWCRGLRLGRSGLGKSPADPLQLKALLAPYPSEGMTCWPVSTRVGSVKNNDASLIER
jgi:hypothetical protein